MWMGRYELVERLGAGGMAEVFLARAHGEAGFSKPCVVKRVLPHLASDPRFIQLFLDEGRLAARLSHPNIVHVFDLGKAGDTFFLAMEYLPGEDVAAILRACQRAKLPLPIPVALHLTLAAAEALHHAHELTDGAGEPLRIVHRDVSPSNLFLTFQGVPKLLDFGVARAASQGHLTQTGEVKGKASYMAPEQALGEEVDRRADVWALAAVLHEMLTGQRLFSARSDAEAVLRVQAEDPAPPSLLRPDVPAPLDAAILRALSRDPAQRPQTSAELRRSLETAWTGEPASQRGAAEFLSQLYGEDFIRERRDRAKTAPGVALATDASAPEPQTAASTHAEPRSGGLRRRVILGAFALAAGGALVWVGIHAMGPPSTTSVSKSATSTAAALEKSATTPPTTSASASAMNTGAKLDKPATAPTTSTSAISPTSATNTATALEKSAASPPTTASSKSVTNVAALERSATSPPTTALTRVEPPPAPGSQREASAPRSPAQPTTSAPGSHPPPARPRTTRHEAATGTLSLVTLPFAEVFLKGRSLGTTPLFSVPLPPGKHALTLRTADGARHLLAIDIHSGRAISLREQIEKLPHAP